jgi:NAD(P)-dependent dehydrogenase (short-subunit alcohol dehydrogenase family)
MNLKSEISNLKLRDKVALVTGASKGLGKAIAAALAEAGADIILVSRNAEQLEETAKIVRAAGTKAFVFRADVTDEAQVAKLGEFVRKETGGPDILVNNAGINVRKTLVELTYTEWRQVMDTNLNSVFLMCREFVPRMKGKSYGRIVCLTSIMSHVSIPGRTAYSASKTGLLGLIRALALELAADGITVNGISPGPFATEMNQPLMENAELNRAFLSKIPVGRWGEPKDIGQLVLYLCSDHANFITGTDLLIDGGWTAQ